MKDWYPFLFALLTLVGCSKSADIPAPATAGLLLRSWAFTGITVITHAKAYPLSGIANDYEQVTFVKDGTYTYLAVGDRPVTPRQRVTGQWILLDKTLTLTDVDDRPLIWTITAISQTEITLTSQKVTDSQPSQTLAERNLVAKAAILFNRQDKSVGGSLDIDAEPEPKSYQLLLTGKAQ
jgi:hypothetical protein